MVLPPVVLPPVLQPVEVLMEVLMQVLMQVLGKAGWRWWIQGPGVLTTGTASLANEHGKLPGSKLMGTAMRNCSSMVNSASAHPQL